MKILLHGCYDNQNFGDVLMADMLSQYLREQCSAEVFCPGMKPEVATALNCTTTTAIAGPTFCKAGVFGGGGYLHGSTIRHAKRLMRYAASTTALRLMRKPYVISGVGVGPNVSGLSKHFIRSICAGARRISVREQQSYDILSKIGVDQGKMEVAADMVMSLKKEDIPSTAFVEAEKVLANINNGSANQRKLCIHLSAKADRDDHLIKILTNIQKGLKKSNDIQIYWLQDHGNFTARYQNLADEHLKNCLVLPPLTHWPLLAVLSEMNCVLTTKLHISIAAWAMHIPVLGYSNHQKTSRFFAQIGRSEFQAMADDDPTVISDWMEAYADEQAGVLADDQERRSELIKLAKRNFELIDETIG